MLMHDHNDHPGTLGLGELALDLNGVSFRTRHNDYSIVKPSTTSKAYGAVEKIKFPDVPPAVLAKKTVSEQTKEMQLWFKAFAEQDYSVRDYRPYFKPLMCYLEGAWTLPHEGELDELTPSARHQFEADDFKQLHNIASFNAYSGHSSNSENFAYLPTKLVVLNNTTPVTAQWNYRILCHPIKKIFPKREHLRTVDDFYLRLSKSYTLEELGEKPTARFEVNAEADDQFYDGTFIHGLLDEIMEEIPGLDNYRGNMTDSTYNQVALHVVQDEPLNAAYYHRWYKVDNPGPMGDFIKHKGFNDKHIFFAMNTQKRVAPINVEHLCSKTGGVKKCQYSATQRWSYAIPLEIVFLTPLGSWNPHDVEYKGHHAGTKGKTVYANGRNGGTTEKKAYDGTNSKSFYQTPVEFFAGDVPHLPADTVKHGVTGVLNKAGKLCKMYASGTNIIMPPIPGVDGNIRLRYPIMGIAADGQTVWKELAALKEYLFNPNAYPKIQNETVSRSAKDSKLPPTQGIFQMAYSSSGDDLGHSHTLRLSSKDISALLKGKQVTVSTVLNMGHRHSVTLKFTKATNSIAYTKCDGSAKCADGHPAAVEKVAMC